MAIRNKTTNIYTEWKPLIDGLPDNDAGVLFKDILKYQNGESVENNNPIWLFIKSKIDDYNANGLKISNARSEAGKLGMAKRWNKKDNKSEEITNDNKCYQMIINDNKNNNKIKENKIKENKIINTYFENFWKLYTPIKSSDGHFVSKGNKQSCMKKFNKLLSEGVKYETIIQGLKQYLTYCRENGYCSCGVEVFLNQRRFENDYSQSECVDSQRQSNQRRPLGIVAIGNELVKMSNYDESDSIPF